MRRLTLLALVALGLAPGTFVRTDLAHGYGEPITITSIDTRAGISGPLQFDGAWEITAPNPHFGGYSALVALGNGNLLAGSDRGRMLELPLAVGEPVAAGGALGHFPKLETDDRGVSDLEAFTSDPESGTIWAAYERQNAIERIAPDRTIVSARPPQMANWSENSGPETMLRLKDGRFLVLAEGVEKRGAKNRPGLLFAGDPVEGAKALEFRFYTSAGYSPVDAALLPDGDVLILERRVEYSIPATFDARLVRADPSDIAQGRAWSGDVLQRLAGPTYGENFEGLEFVPDPGDPETGSLYLIADDNLSLFQRTLLVRFAWPPPEPDDEESEGEPGADK